jgi:hypothetical protein
MAKAFVSFAMEIGPDGQGDRSACQGHHASRLGRYTSGQGDDASAFAGPLFINVGAVGQTFGNIGGETAPEADGVAGFVGSGHSPNNSNTSNGGGLSQAA